MSTTKIASYQDSILAINDKKYYNVPTCSSPSFLIISVTVYYQSNQYLKLLSDIPLPKRVDDNILSYQTKYCKTLEAI